MKIHEYQAKELLKRHGVPVPDGAVAESADQAAEAFQKLGGGTAVVKAQIHAGGRGKAGGVKMVRSWEEARAAAAAMLGRSMVTHQTGPEGRLVKKVLVEKASEVSRELYLAVVMDRGPACPVLLGSREGGMEIEEVAARDPSAILREEMDPLHGLFPFQARRMALALGFTGGGLRKAASIMQALGRAYSQADCSILEINPLILTAQGEVLALDAKVNFDQNALYRHPELAELRDLDEEDPREVEAGRHNLNYIALDGTIGCMVNGAGLAMATMDTIKLHGGMPANFLDVGGGANREQVTQAFKLLLQDPGVKAVLVNIFGGIMKCDVIAEGILAAAREVRLDRPLVVRLEGTRVREGRGILEGSGLPILSAASLDEAARMAVDAAGGAVA